MYFLSSYADKVVPVTKMDMAIQGPIDFPINKVVDCCYKRAARAGYWALWPGVFTLYSDSVLSHVVSSQSILGRFLIHGVSYNTFGLLAPITAVLTSALAGLCYRCVKKYLFPQWLKENDNRSCVAQLVLRAVCHMTVGAVLGYFIFHPALFSATTGLAIGTLTFIAYLIKCGAEKILGLHRDPTQEKIYEQLGLPKTAKAIYYYPKKKRQNDEKYDAWIRKVVLDEITGQQNRGGHTVYSLKEKTRADFQNRVEPTITQEDADRLVSCIEKMGEIIDKDKSKKDKFKYMLLAELSLRVAWCAINKKSSYENEVQYPASNDHEIDIEDIELLENLKYQENLKFDCLCRKYVSPVLSQSSQNSFLLTENQTKMINKIFKFVKAQV